MDKGIIFVNRIKNIVDDMERNPHWLHKKAGLTYSVVRKLYNAKTIPDSTPIGTLWSIAQALNKTVDELYTPTEEILQ